jgi:hypothetical protein
MTDARSAEDESENWPLHWDHQFVGAGVGLPPVDKPCPTKMSKPKDLQSRKGLTIVSKLVTIAMRI